MANKSLALTNYNIFALQGDDTVDDMDVVETMGLDPKVAYTPDINDAAIKKMYHENVDSYIKSGMDEKEAKKLAEFHASAAHATIAAAMRDQKKQFQI
ncbi:MAG TPA: hypothetical protein P5539_05650 [Mesotoga sp.]|nr:hypothetical protein [Mesotoga sp.]